MWNPFQQIKNNYEAAGQKTVGQVAQESAPQAQGEVVNSKDPCYVDDKDGFTPGGYYSPIPPLDTSIPLLNHLSHIVFFPEDDMVAVVADEERITATNVLWDRKAMTTTISVNYLGKRHDFVCIYDRQHDFMCDVKMEGNKTSKQVTFSYFEGD
jgi:hypothetical protein